MLLLLLALATPAVSVAPEPPVTQESEMLGLDTPDEFRMGNHQTNGMMDLGEMVVPPETVDHWTKLITIQIARGIAWRVSADSFYFNWNNRMRGACPGMIETHVSGTVDGHHAVRGELACPKNPQTGLPEILTAAVIQGQANLLIAQVAFKHAPTTRDKALVEHVMRSLKVCNQPTLAACKARKTMGFVAGGQ